MRAYFFAALLASYSVMAADYRIDPGATLRQGSLEVRPTVHGPAGAALRYEMRTVREGTGGSSNSSQSGNVRLGSDGTASLASTSVNVSPKDRYTIYVRLLDGGRVVAEETVRYPD